jgi:hypothetical protein
MKRLMEIGIDGKVKYIIGDKDNRIEFEEVVHNDHDVLSKLVALGDMVFQRMTNDKRVNVVDTDNELDKEE